MSKFAKVFERDNEQVVVRKNNSNEGHPAVIIEGRSKSGYIVELMMACTNDGGDEAGKKRDTLFEKIDADQAWGLIESTPGYSL